jgi:MFS family permease
VSNRANVAAQLGIGLGSAAVALVVPLPVMISLYFANAHLGFGGLLTVGFAVVFLILIPGIAASILAGWLVDRRTPEGRRPFAILMAIVGVLQLAAIAAIIVATARVGASLWVPISLIVPAILLTFGLLRLGEWAGHKDAARALSEAPQAEIDWRPIPRSTLRRTVWMAVATFGGVAVVGLVLVWAGSTNIIVEGSNSSQDSARIVSFSLTALTFAFLGADVVLLVGALPVGARIKPLFRGSYLTQKIVSRVVLRGKADELDAEGRVIATKYAEIMAAYLPLNLASLLALYAALASMRLSSLVDLNQHYLLVFNLVMLGALVLTGILAVPFGISRTRRVRRYALANAELLPPLP